VSAHSHMRGWPITWKGIDNMWVYDDDGTVADDSRPCVRCGRHPTPEGYDACLGYIEGATAACCGHGVEGERDTMRIDKNNVEVVEDKVIINGVSLAAWSLKGFDGSIDPVRMAWFIVEQYKRGANLHSLSRATFVSGPTITKIAHAFGIARKHGGRFESRFDPELKQIPSIFGDLPG